MTDSQLLFLIGNLWAVAGIASNKTWMIPTGCLFVLVSVFAGLSGK